MIIKPGLKNINVLMENNTILDSELLYDSFTLVRVQAEKLTARGNSLSSSKVSSYAHIKALEADISDLRITNVK